MDTKSDILQRQIDNLITKNKNLNADKETQVAVNRKIKLENKALKVKLTEYENENRKLKKELDKVSDARTLIAENKKLTEHNAQLVFMVDEYKKLISFININLPNIDLSNFT